MSLHAIEEIDDALQRTKDIVLPFDLMDWTRLAIISLFLGGVGVTNIISNMPSSFPRSGEYGATGSEAMTGMVTAAPSVGDIALLAVVAVFGLGILGLLYLNSVFTFVMFRSIREKNPRVRKNFKDHMGDGFKYFLFQIGLFIIGLTAFIAWIASFAVSPIVGGLLILVLVPVFIILAIFSGIVHDFTLQDMIASDKGFIAAVKESTYEITDSWKEFGGYLLFRLLISWAVGIMSFFVVMMATLILAIPFILVGAVAYMITPALAWIVAGIGLIVWFVALLYVNVPFRVYTYSYFVELYDAFIES